MQPVIATCGKCKARQVVTAEVKKVRDALSPNTFGAYTWKCKVCGFVNQGMVPYGYRR
jgi:rubrerythrin